MPLHNPIDDPGEWLRPTLLNGWAAYGSSYPTAAYRRNSEGTIYMRGVVANPSPVYGQPICQLSTGYRPGAPQTFICVSGDFSTTSIEIGRVDVATNGQVIYYYGGGSYFSLTSIIFLAGG